LFGMRRCHVWVSGKVQGVWFRSTCVDRAQGLGLAGWARNLADGRVEVIAEGDANAVSKLVEWCHEGSPRSWVTGVEVRDEEPEGLSGFVINR